jgi:hypothetical protein
MLLVDFGSIDNLFFNHPSSEINTILLLLDIVINWHETLLSLCDFKYARILIGSFLGYVVELHLFCFFKRRMLLLLCKIYLRQYFEFLIELDFKLKILLVCGRLWWRELGEILLNKLFYTGFGKKHRLETIDAVVL